MAGKKSPSIFSTLQKTTENASAVNGELTRQLPVASLVDNPLNRFSMAEDDEFLSTMRSVEQDGFLEDIVVTPDGENTWRIISGHRRVMAARKLGKTAVPCKVRRYPDKLSELRALMGANVHRRSLSPFDMARQLETLREVLSESGQLPDDEELRAGPPRLDIRVEAWDIPRLDERIACLFEHILHIRIRLPLAEARLRVPPDIILCRKDLLAVLVNESLVELVLHGTASS